MSINIKNAMYIALTVGSAPLQTNAQGEQATQYCHSTYRVEQQLDMTLNFGQQVNRQKVELSVILDVRELPRDSAQWNAQHRTLVMLARPELSRFNGIDRDLSSSYIHPFMVTIDRRTGALIELTTSETDSKIIKQYLGIIDLFQYSHQQGSYQYRNGNGLYQGQLSLAYSEIRKRNMGYIDPDNKLRVKDSEWLITPANNGCFYQQAIGREGYTMRFSPKVTVSGHAKTKITRVPQLKLDDGHMFYILSNNISQWPTYQAPLKITQEQAVAQLSKLFTQLQKMIDKPDHITALLNKNQALWPHFADFIVQNEHDNRLLQPLFKALKHINSSHSVSALTQLVAIGDTLPRLTYQHAVSLLARTTAKLNERALTSLSSHLDTLIEHESIGNNGSLILQSLALMANRRTMQLGSQSIQLKQLLYQQLGRGSDQHRATVLYAIGKLAKNIDSQGRALLISSIDDNNQKVRFAVAQALNSVPYRQQELNFVINTLNTESDPDVKTQLINVLGKVEPSNNAVKTQLLSFINTSGQAEHKTASIISLHKVGFSFDNNETKLIGRALKHENNLANQKALASLILNTPTTEF